MENSFLGPLLLTRLNLNPSMDKQSYAKHFNLLSVHLIRSEVDFRPVRYWAVSMFKKTPKNKTDSTSGVVQWVSPNWIN